jgi:uncharacterized RDD family membrane protein YckC
MTEQQFSHIELNAADSSAEPAADLWRNEVQARIARYKTRRGRRVEGAFSMRFPFPVDEIVEPAPTVEEDLPITELTADIPEEVPASASPLEGAPVSESLETTMTALLELPDGEEQEVAAQNVELALDPTSAPEPEPFVDMVPRPRPKRKVIAFPRHLSIAPETVYRLADPVTSEVSRILDVPEELEAIPTTPFLDGLQLDPVKSPDDMRDREHVDLPFRAVGISQRVVAGMIDGAIAGIGVAVFGAVAYKIIPQLAITKPLVLALVAMAPLLWSVYQYLFVVYAGRTFGMMATKIRLRTFKGKTPTLLQRRKRVLGFYLSALSLGMGLMWVFVDVDALCWHDRLSQTYLAERD